jgi:hypothetical protein
MTLPAVSVIVALLVSVTHSSPVWLGKRTITINILQAGSGVTDGCDATQIQQLTDMISDTKSLAQSAITTLAQANVEKSSGFVAMFGSE